MMMNSMTPFTRFFMGLLTATSLGCGLLLPNLSHAEPPSSDVLHQQLSSQMASEEAQLMADLDFLWRHALQNNPSVLMAMEKMANKSEENKTAQAKSKKAFASTMLKQAISLGGLGSAIALGSPLPMVGSSVFSQFTSITDAQQQLNNITPTDMVLLAREISHIQTQLVKAYLDYKLNTQQESFYQTLSQQLGAQVAQHSLAHQPVPESLNQQLLDSQWKLKQAQAHRLMARQVLMWSCGSQALDALDQRLANPQAPESNATSHLDAPNPFSPAPTSVISAAH